MTPDRKKILDRYRKLAALAGSPNAHEAKRAQERADDLAAKHDITAEEIAETGRQSSTRLGGKIDRDGWWRERVAMVLGKHYACRALKAKERVFFEGERAVEAAAAYRQAVATIDSESKRRFNAYDRAFRMSMGEGWWTTQFLTITVEALEKLLAGYRDKLSECNLRTNADHDGWQTAAMIIREIPT